MTLSSGTRLGPYEIVAPIGAGGMGEVYRARDTQLGRDVALKILPEAFASDPDRLMRFEREARALASLNHPNIAAIYGVQESGSPDVPGAPPMRALVMELVEGDDLSVRLASGALPLEEALSVARQIAAALEAAHESGIVHRDLKPANIKIRDDGRVKVLDFGLAKALNSGPGTQDSGLRSASAGEAATVTSPALTALGLVLGTAAYMAPEQAKGRPVDKRADIWAFGVVLYEMLTGRSLFQAEDVSETLAAVLTRDVSLDAMPANLPAGVRLLLADCLIRDPRQRLRDMGDVRLMLDRLDRRLDDDVPSTLAAPAGRPPWMWPAVAAVAIGAVTLLGLSVTQRAAETPEVYTFELAPPNLSPAEVISPDGRSVIYASRATDTQLVGWWLRPMGVLDVTPVPGSDRAPNRLGSLSRRPAWAPDSRAVVFVNAQGGLTHVDLDTRQTKELVPGGSTLTTGAWSQDGVILYGRRDSGASSIWRVPESGGAPSQVTALAGAGPVAQVPCGFLPDGRRFLYLQTDIIPGAGAHSEVFIGSIDLATADQSTTPLLRTDGPPVYSDGYLLYVSQESLMARPFDPGTATFTGDAVQLLSGVAPYVSVSENGSLVYRMSGADDSGKSELRRFAPTGELLGVIGPSAQYGGVRALSDGKRLTVERRENGERFHLHVVDIASKVFTRLNPSTFQDSAAAPRDDQTIAFSYHPNDDSRAGIPGRDIYLRPASGVGEPLPLVESGNMKHANDWAPGGQYLIYDAHVEGRAQDLMIVSRDGGTPVPFLATEADESAAQFSPDGKWIVYQSNETGQNEIYVRDFVPGQTPAAGTQRIKISESGGRTPRWHGNKIYFGQGTRLMRATVRLGPPFQADPAQPVMDLRPSGLGPYDVMPDGSLIIPVAVDTPVQSAPPMRLVLNWQSWLKQS